MSRLIFLSKFIGAYRFSLIVGFALLVGLLAYSGASSFKPLSNDLVLDSLRYQYGRTPTISLGGIQGSGRHYINLKFNFRAREFNSLDHQNLFQTGPENTGVRLEMSGDVPVLIFKDKVVSGDATSIPIEKHIEKDTWNRLELEVRDQAFIRLKVNGTLVLDYVSHGLMVNMTDIKLGSGYDSSRSFKGDIKDIALTKATYFKNISYFFMMLFCGVIFLLSFNQRRMNLDSKENDSIFAPLKIFSMGSAILGALLFSLIVIKFLGATHIGLTKWIAHLTLLSALVIFMFFNKKLDQLLGRFRLLGILIFLIYGMAMFKSSLKDYFTEIAVVILFVSLAQVYFFSPFGRYISEFGLRYQPVKRKIFLLVDSLTFFLFFFASWAALTKTTNWSFFEAIFLQQPELATIGMFLIFRVAYLITYLPLSNSLWSKANQSGVKDFLRSYIDIPIVVLFLFFSFRCDSLFIPGSEYHWEYFVGVIQGVNNGGILLWDTPSQYGFLNILLPSLIKAPSPWQSFYIFQGILLFVVASMNYWMLNKIAPDVGYKKILIFPIVFLSVFYATPEFVGPYPFPSSSVMRFFCVYLMIYTASLIRLDNNKSAFMLAFVWVLSVLWSAESALYGTTILAFILGAIYLSTDSFKLAWRYCYISITFLVSTIMLLIFFYQIRFGVFPDFLCFFEHATGYAKGFGFVPVKWNGAGNILFLVMLGIGYVCFILLRNLQKIEKTQLVLLAALLGMVWAISTYYIGRPVPQNITAMLPLITLAVISCVFFTHRYLANHENYLTPIRGVSVALLFFVMAPLANLNWYEGVKKAEFFSADVSSKLNKSNVQLNKLLIKANKIDSSLLVYYGDDATPPIFTGSFARYNYKNWLPIPLQLLETPMSDQRREIYFNRYLCREKPKSGIFLVRVGGQITTRRSNFFNYLENYYEISLVDANREFEIFSFVEKNAVCDHITNK